MTPALSIIVVNHNAGPHLADVVGAALLAAPHAQLVVVDNGSGDNSISTLLERHSGDSRLHLVRIPGNIGFGRAVNYAARWCRGELMLILNPDCHVRADTIAACSAALAAHPEAAMAGCLLQNPDGSEQRGCRRQLPKPASALAFFWSRFSRSPQDRDFNLTGQPLPAAPVLVEAISGAFMLIRSKIFRHINGFDAGYFLHGEDLDLCLRLKQLGFGILFVPQAAATHWQGSCSTRRPFFVAWHKHAAMWRYYRLHLAAGDPLPMRLLVPLGIMLHWAWAVLQLGARRLACARRSSPSCTP